MIRLTEITEENWLEAASLSVKEEQKGFLAPAGGIIARGYVYRNSGGRVIVIQDDDAIVGLALVREFTDEPLGYDLQQFMIDKKYQGKGYGRQALQLALDYIYTFPVGKAKYIWLSYEPSNETARNLYRSLGFKEVKKMPEGWDEIPAVIKIKTNNKINQ